MMSPFPFLSQYSLRLTLHIHPRQIIVVLVNFCLLDKTSFPIPLYLDKDIRKTGRQKMPPVLLLCKHGYYLGSTLVIIRTEALS